MPQHYTRDTIEVSVWCNVCRKETMHRVDDRRRGPCLQCLKKLEQEAANRPKPPVAQQGKLF
jgi:ribosomal protein L44E